jgi:hypothetical protein
MWLTVRMVLLSWRFKGTAILSLKINIAFLLLYGILKKIKIERKIECMYELYTHVCEAVYS